MIVLRPRHPYHRALFRERKLDITNYIESSIRRHTGRALVLALAEGARTEDRFFGPYSVVKNDVRVRGIGLAANGEPFSFSSEFRLGGVGSDPLVSPRNESFSSPRRLIEELSTRHHVRRLIRSLQRDFTAAAAAHPTCPICGGELTFHFHPLGGIFTASCEEFGGAHLMFHASTSRPPDDWRQRVSHDWLD